MDNVAWNRIQTVLVPEEYIVWNGKPGKGHLFTKDDIVYFPLSIFISVFFLFVFTVELMGAAPLKVFFVTCLASIPILYESIGRYVVRLYFRKKTEYFITNKQIIRLRHNKIDMISGHALDYKKITRWNDGSGTIEFYKNHSSLIYWNMRETNFILDNIQNVSMVLSLIEDLSERP